MRSGHWNLRWSSLWGHETLHWVREAHAGCATGAFGRDPYGATKRCAGWGGTHAGCDTSLRVSSHWGHDAL
eukprot:8409781-Pyramimonas_sp.AAC.1